MTGSPFSNVVGTDGDSKGFTDVEATGGTDTTTETDARPADDGSESSIGVEVAAPDQTKVAGEDETAGDAASGTPTPGQ
jgi:hypothetical protein